MLARVEWEFPEIKRNVLRPHDKRHLIAHSPNFPASSKFQFWPFFPVDRGIRRPVKV
jgi:hypothetical protein